MTQAAGPSLDQPAGDKTSDKKDKKDKKKQQYKQQKAAANNVESPKRGATSSSVINDTEDNSKRQKLTTWGPGTSAQHKELFINVNNVIKGRRIRFGTCGHNRAECDFTTNIETYLLQRGLNEANIPEPHLRYFVYEETLALCSRKPSFPSIS